MYNFGAVAQGNEEENTIHCLFMSSIFGHHFQAPLSPPLIYYALCISTNNLHPLYHHPACIIHHTLCIPTNALQSPQTPSKKHKQISFRPCRFQKKYIPLQCALIKWGCEEAKQAQMCKNRIDNVQKLCFCLKILHIAARLWVSAITTIQLLILTKTLFPLWINLLHSKKV